MGAFWSPRRPMLYFGVGPDRARKGAAILEVLRQTWGRLIHKQWLLFYPLALGVIGTIAFVAVYASSGRPLTWTTFFQANFQRWEFVKDTYVSGFDFTPALGVAVAVGLGLCLLTAMIRAPYFRAIAGPGYPLAPRNSREAARLTLFYVFSSLVVWVLPLAGSSGSITEQLVAFVVLVIAIITVFADYVIVFEDVGFVAGLRRSLHLLVRRWVPVVVIFIVLQLVYFGLRELYSFYYDNADGVLIVLPLVQIVVDAFLVLLVDLLLIFLYEQARKSDHA
jgi:hypothetical protein